MSRMLTRYLEPYVREDLKSKMVFLGGPRQVRKTTLAQVLIADYRDEHPAYLNWDFEPHKKKIKNWRTLIKGYYDTLKNTHSFLIAGSARLDHFRKGGDSLLWQTSEIYGAGTIKDWIV